MNNKEKSLVALCIVLLLLVSGGYAIQTKSESFKWIKTDQSVALAGTERIVWQFNYGKGTSKPHFHPVSLVDGTVLTQDRPADHPHHHGLWFTWKFINGVNFWEENPKTRQSDGKTDWSNVKVTMQNDHSAVITMDLTYSHKGQTPIMSEKRTIYVSSPDADGVYYIDWKSQFKACSDIDVKLDRTPLPHEKDGVPWGGYAGLSVRLNGDGQQWIVSTEKNKLELTEECFRVKALSMDYSGVFNDQLAGITILDHPENLNSPTPWYVYENKVMKYFSPAVICYEPFTLQAGNKLELNYRVLIHRQRWDGEKLKSQIKKYTSVSDKKE